MIKHIPQIIVQNSEPQIQQQLLTIEEAAVVLGMTEKALRQRLHRGEGPPIYRLSERTIRISRCELTDWLANHRQPSAPSH